MKQNYTRKEVVQIIDDLLQHADAVMDAIQNEDPKNSPEELLEMVENWKRKEWLNQLEITDAHQYNKDGTNAGEIEQFCIGEPLANAPVYTINDPSKRMCICIPTEQPRQSRELCWSPTDWVIKNKQSRIDSITDKEYNTWKVKKGK